MRRGFSQDQQKPQGEEQLLVRPLPVEKEEQPQEQQVPAVDAVQVEAVQEFSQVSTSHWGKSAEEPAPRRRGAFPGGGGPLPGPAGPPIPPEGGGGGPSGAVLGGVSSSGMRV